MDSQLVYWPFTDSLDAARVVRGDHDMEMRREVEICRQRLHAGQHGQLQELWVGHDEVEPGHRHVTRLWGLYPSGQISREGVDLVKACNVTLARRAASGGGHTGWSRAWMITPWALLGGGDGAAKHI